MISNLIIFGLKSVFEEPFTDNNEFYENILKIPTNNQSQIIQEFFDPFEVICQSDDIKDKYSNLINVLLEELLTINEQRENENEIKEASINNNKKIRMKNIILWNN